MTTHETAASMAMLPREYRVMFEIEEEYWWYRGLRVLLHGLIEQYVAADGSAKILDAGCGTGKNLQILARHGDAWGVDIAAEAIQFCRMRGMRSERTLVASLLELPFVLPTVFLAEQRVMDGRKISQESSGVLNLAADIS